MTSEPIVHVGEGVRAALARRGDRALGDEVELRPGWTITPGEQCAYLWSEASDQVYAVPKA